MSLEREPIVPSLADVRSRLIEQRPRIGTGWPVLDVVTGGVPVGRTTTIRGPQMLRLQVLGRMAAWAAGEGYPTILAARAWSTDELWMAVGSGGLGLAPEALLGSTEHDAWVDDRLRVIDLRVFGGTGAPHALGDALNQRGAAMVIIADYLESDWKWNDVLDPASTSLDLNVVPRQLGCALVLGGTSMSDFSDWLEQSAVAVRLSPEEEGRRVRVSGYEGNQRRSHTVLLRDDFLESPRFDAKLVRRAGVHNIWEERSPDEVASFADALGGRVSKQWWEQDRDEDEG